jgi:hypothetical protein
VGVESIIRLGRYEKTASREARPFLHLLPHR